MATAVMPFAPLKIYDIRKTDRKLGSGAFATVFEVEWNGTACAAKFMHDNFKEILSAEEKQTFIAAFEKECATWSALRHPQIVQFLGIYFDPSHTPVLVLEKMDASLRSLLESTPKQDFPLINKVVILRQVAQGLVYLHSHSPKLVHHDLSPNNILVNEVTYLTKLTDFGMTRAIDAASLTRSSSIKGTPGFMPPEALRYPPHYDDKLDVFSYGNVIIMTIIHEWPTPPVPELGGEPANEVLSQFQLREHHFQQFSKEEMKGFGKIAKLCLENEGMNRPTSTMLLAEMKKSEAIILESGLSAETEASNIQLAMWRMQKAVQKKETEIATVNVANQSLQSNISRFNENARRLEQHLEHLHLESQMEESIILDDSSSTVHYISPHVQTGLETDPLLSSETHTSSDTGSATATISEVETAASGNCHCCFRQGKCACCLFTSMVIMSIISIILAFTSVRSTSYMDYSVYNNCTCCFPSLLAPPHRLYQGASITAALQIFLSVVLTTALMVRFLLWCRGERRKGLTLICSPIVMLLTVSLFTISGMMMPLLIVSTQQKLQPFEPPSDNWSAVLVASFSVFFMGLALLCFLIVLRWIQ